MRSSSSELPTAAHMNGMTLMITRNPQQDSAPFLDRLLTIDEVSDYLQTPKSTLYSLRSDGRGPLSRRVGRSLRYRRADVESWLDSLPTETARNR